MGIFRFVSRIFISILTIGSIGTIINYLFYEVNHPQYPAVAEVAFALAVVFILLAVFAFYRMSVWIYHGRPSELRFEKENNNGQVRSSVDSDS